MHTSKLRFLHQNLIFTFLYCQAPPSYSDVADVKKKRGVKVKHGEEHVANAENEDDDDEYEDDVDSREFVPLYTYVSDYLAPPPYSCVSIYFS
jgi:hypothetical protein